jgi:metal-sulfur cluster biosynthetic enzyme
VSRVEVVLMWDPPWLREMMSEEAKLQLEMMGIAWSEARPRGARRTGLTIGRTPGRPRGEPG